MRVLVLLSALLGLGSAARLPFTHTLTSNGIGLELNFRETNISAQLSLNGTVKLSATIGEGVWNLQDNVTWTCNDDIKGCMYTTAKITFSAVATSTKGLGYQLTWLSNDLSTKFTDCIDLNSSSLHWYGGSEKWHDDWPEEHFVIPERAVTTLTADNLAVDERYWLNSIGGYIFVNDNVPLFLDQNNLRADTICLIAAAKSPYIRRERVHLSYAFMLADDPKSAQLAAVNNFLKKPTGHPDERVIRHPIWTTWAKYKKVINDQIVVDFARDIVKHGFTGQLEIDDSWEICYGSLQFNDTQFANINETVKTLKSLNFTVSLWTHPFVNSKCKETSDYGVKNGYFLVSNEGGDETSWWDGNPARHIDFTKPEAAKWYIDRLRLLQERNGIDSFKFDAGESDHPPLHPITQGDPELAPNSITETYIRTCATFGGLIEARAASRTQDLPTLLRMQDKDSDWSLGNGLHALITTLLRFNIIGYVMVLPDMVGGNGYRGEPSAELLARWTQANTFMPTMQFSYLPWDITSKDFDGLAIIKKFVKLHEDYADEILSAMNKAIEDGTPVNPPIWWVDPSNEEALKCNDEFLLGESILVAPVIVEGAVTRDVLLPKGTWKDGNTGVLIEGPTTLKDYAAPIDVLPYFIKQ